MLLSHPEINRSSAETGNLIEAEKATLLLKESVQNKFDDKDDSASESSRSCNRTCDVMGTASLTASHVSSSQ